MAKRAENVAEKSEALSNEVGFYSSEQDEPDRVSRVDLLSCDVKTWSRQHRQQFPCVILGDPGAGSQDD